MLCAPDVRYLGLWKNTNFMETRFYAFGVLAHMCKVPVICLRYTSLLRKDISVQCVVGRSQLYGTTILITTCMSQYDDSSLGAAAAAVSMGSQVRITLRYLCSSQSK